MTMTINLIPNDPSVVDLLPMRSVAPRKNRPAGRAGFRSDDVVAEGRYPAGSSEFLFWQVREAALWAVEAWERATGQTVKTWASHAAKQLVLVPDAGLEVNAYYDRRGLVFYHYTVGRSVRFSGASTDVVAHEAGHAILDAMRSDLWETPYLEVAAFHEAFGDCVAFITGFSDPATRRAIMAGGMLGRRNYLEAWGEDLAAGVKHVNRRHNGAAPRYARNTLKWKLPSALPDDGPPSVVIKESHSLARVFTGCFYDAIRNVVADRGTTTGAGLWNATKTVSSLLARAAANAPESARFFQTVGQAMVLADRAENEGRNVTAIQNAFEGHGILLGSNALLGPTATLAGPPPSAARAALAPSTRRDLIGRFGATSGGHLTASAIHLGGQRVVKAVHTRNVPLDDIDDRLRGVVCQVPESVIVGASGRRAAAFAGFPEARTTDDEVATFVRSLLHFDRLELGTTKRSPRKAGAGDEPTGPDTTHTTRRKGKVQVLARLRFACAGCGR